MIWLKNSVDVIGSNSPLTTSGARQRSTPSPRREFCARCAFRDLLAPFAAGNLEQIARFAPVVHHPIQMRADQTSDALLRAAGRGDRRQHRGVIALQHFQKQRARQFLLRSEEMEEAAVRSPRAGANGRNRRALKAVTVEHRQSRGQQILARASGHHRPFELHLDHYSRVIL